MGVGVRVKVWGDYALFSRPEMKVERCSYDVMTPSAARGILEAIYWHPGLSWVIDKIYVKNPIRFTSVRRNEIKSKASANNILQVYNGADKPLYISTKDDIVQMDYLYISTYAKNNSLADLSEYVDSGVIDTSTIDKNIMKTGDSNGKTVGIPLSTTALAVTYNPTVIEQAGAEVPSDDWTWDDYITLNEKVAKSTGKPSALAATAGIFGDVNIFNYWVRSQGESLFNEDGTALGYDDDKITSDFFDMWKKMADDNVAPDADEQTQIASLGKEGLPIVTDEAATDIEWNAFPTTVSSANPNLKLAVMPNAKDSGLWLKPGMFFSVSETSKVKEECAKFINWFVNSNEANEILLGERGTPVSSDVRDNLIERDKLSEQQKEAFEYTDKVSAVVGETPAADPSGIAEVNEAFASAGNSVLYGQLTSKEAAKQFREKANAILERNNAQ